MKQYTYLTFAIVLTAVLLVGCGCTNQNTGVSSEPTVLPTNEERWESTESTTRATTEATMPSETQDRGNGPLEDMLTEATGSTQNTEGGANSRSASNGNSEGGANGRSGSTGSTEEGMDSHSRSMIPGMR